MSTPCQLQLPQQWLNLWQSLSAHGTWDKNVLLVQAIIHDQPAETKKHKYIACNKNAPISLLLNMKHQWRKKAAAAQRMKKGTSSIYFLLAIWFVLPAQTLNPTENVEKVAINNCIEHRHRYYDY